LPAKPKAAVPDPLRDLEASISADEELRLLLGTKGHPLSAQGRAEMPDGGLIQDLAQECRDELEVWASGKPIRLAPLPPGQVKVPRRREKETEAGTEAEMEWGTEVVASNSLRLYPVAFGAFTRVLSSFIVAISRELSMTEKQVARAHAPLEKLVGKLVLEFDQRLAQRQRRGLASTLTGTLRERCPHLSKQQAQLVAVRIAELAGAENPRSGGDRLERLGRRKRRQGKKKRGGQKSSKNS
jgi:hypothetical protein